MPRYLVQSKIIDRTGAFPGRDAYQDLSDIIERNARKGVNWVLSFVSQDDSYCIYDAPSSDLMRSIAMCSRHVVEKITEVKILDPALHD